MAKKGKYNIEEYREDSFDDFKVRRLYSVATWWVGQTEYAKVADFLKRIGSYPEFFNKARNGKVKTVTPEMLDCVIREIGVNANYFFYKDAPMFDHRDTNDGATSQSANNSRGTFQVGNDISGHIHVGDTVYNGMSPEMQVTTLELMRSILAGLEAQREKLREDSKKNEALIAQTKEALDRVENSSEKDMP